MFHQRMVVFVKVLLTCYSLVPRTSGRRVTSALLDAGMILVTEDVALLSDHRADSAPVDCYRCRSNNFSDANCHDPFRKDWRTLVKNCSVQLGSTRVPADTCIKVVGTSGEWGGE